MKSKDQTLLEEAYEAVSKDNSQKETTDTDIIFRLVGAHGLYKADLPDGEWLSIRKDGENYILIHSYYGPTGMKSFNPSELIKRISELPKNKLRSLISTGSTYTESNR